MQGLLRFVNLDIAPILSSEEVMSDALVIEQNGEVLLPKIHKTTDRRLHCNRYFIIQ